MNRRFLSFLAVFCLGIFGHGNLQAVLEFEQESIELNADWQDKQIDTSFNFTNTGWRPVRIQQIRSSCGCTAATPGKMHFEPGESGTIDASFTVGNRQGTQRNRITVVTDEASYVLEMIVHVPVVWELRSRVLVWRESEQGATKSAELIVHDPSIQSVELRSRADSFWEVSLVQSKERQGVWVLNAQPDSFEAQRRESVALRLTREDGTALNANLFLRML